MIELTKEQQTALDGIIARIEQGIQQTSIGGLAGTGKSVLLKALHDALVAKKRKVHVAAPTGKACDVLLSKGVKAATLHSTLCTLKDKRTQTATKRWADGRTTEYETVLQLDWCDKKTRQYDVLLVDESSMIDHDMYRRIIDTRRPVVFVGDHGQLPPFGGRKVNVMADPDFRLETVHRNAGEIVRFAAHLRNGGLPLEFQPQDDSVQFGHDDVHEADQIICGSHSVRTAINRVRATTGDTIQAGDRLVSLKNDSKLGLYNGTIITVTRVDECVVHWQDRSGTPKACEYDPQYLMTWPRPDPTETPYHPFDFGWAITCHSAQGSEWDSVAVVDQGDLWLREGIDTVNRWRYTAATRARRKLWWMTGRPVTPSQQDLVLWQQYKSQSASRPRWRPGANEA